MTVKINTDLKKLYYDPKLGLLSAEKFYLKVKQMGLSYTRKEIKDFVTSQSVSQVLKPIVKPKIFNSYRANYAGEIYQMDIIVYDRYEYHKYKYILVVIDIYSRYVEARAMTNRELETIIKNYEDIIKQMGAPEEIQSDNEFNKQEFIKVLDRTNTIYRFSDPDEMHKNPIVERVNGTITKLLQKIRITTKRKDWYNYLSDAVENYNSTDHSTIKHTPEDVFDEKEPNEQKYNYIPNPYEVGNLVRIQTRKKIFDKGDILTSSKKTYKVISIDKNKIQLEGLKKLYKPYELSRVYEVEEEEIEEPKTETKTKQRRNLLKRIDVQESNILSTKRQPKPKIKD